MIPYNDFLTLVAITSPQYANHREAHGALRSFVSHLAPVSEKAREAMVYLKMDFFDSVGNVKTTDQIIQTLHDSVLGMEEEELTLALKTIFGADALRTAHRLSLMTGDDFKRRVAV